MTEASQYIYIYSLIYPFTGPATNHCPENGLSHLRMMECSNVLIISLQLVTYRFYANEYWLIATKLYERIPIKTTVFLQLTKNTSVVSYNTTKLCWLQPVIWHTNSMDSYVYLSTSIFNGYHSCKILKTASSAHTELVKFLLVIQQWYFYVLVSIGKCHLLVILTSLAMSCLS